MASSDTEPFPPLHGSFAPKVQHRHHPHSMRRRKSSGLGAELPGDNVGGSFATLDGTTPPLTPTDSPRGSAKKPTRRSKRRSIRRALSKWKRLCLKHTWLMPLVLTLALVSLYLMNPVPSNPLSAALFLSYPLPREAGSDSPIHYGKGARDFAFVAFYTIVLSFTREFIMQRIIRPIAIRWGIRNKAKQARFMEQFYTAVYFSIFGPFGLYVMSRTPIWYFNTTAMYEGFPHKTHEAVFKAYYLLQAAYWTQQIIVLLLMLEKPRKDFKELVAHHVITIALIWLSYRFHFTYMGIAVYITMDISDFFLATSKVLNYIDSPIVGPYFFVFICVWAYLRHYVNLRILFSIFTEFATVGPFEINWETQQYKCTLSQYISFGLLAALQAVNAFWFFLILRIAYRFVTTNVAEDERSEYEGSDAEEMDEADGEVKEVETKEKENGKPVANGVVKGAPKVLVNGEEALTPKRMGGTPEPDSVGARLRERKSNPK
ncbi:LAG1-domain-containing protein [Amniculicola lignicola CBS 123094]|uniref:LAG1-domain-containing protein n=1 Tax=Amniculicola lignicola CBS 123094 TaxID=1392246 RepID=A0A6A5WXS4_9PLEO|nr:LAG1-domain-containing protein [Amniculicola lignicola CBS 123094]